MNTIIIKTSHSETTNLFYARIFVNGKLVKRFQSKTYRTMKNNAKWFVEDTYYHQTYTIEEK